MAIVDVHHFIHETFTILFCDFLSSINSLKREKGTFKHNLESLEMLAMCLEKTSNPPGSFNTCKTLDEIPAEDVIEIFI